MTTQTLDPERQIKARIYARIQRQMILIDLGLGLVYLLAWLLSGWPQGLKDFLLRFSTNNWFIVAGFGLVFGGIYVLLNLPLSYYTGFILPHRFELSTQTIKGWMVDQVKGFLLSIVLGGILLEVVYLVLRNTPNTWWLWVGFVLLFFNVILSMIAPVIIAPLFFKFQPLGEEHSDLALRLVNLFNKANTRVKGVYRFDMSRRTKAANAALFGIGSTRRIILGDTLLDQFSNDEIETVMAHELGHQVHKDILVGIVFVSTITLAGLYFAAQGYAGLSAWQGAYTPGDVTGMPLLALFLGTYGLVTTPLENAFSRWREKLADEFAVRITGNGKAFASALNRLANQNLAEVDPEPWVEFFLYSHPALKKRIALAEQKDLG